MKVQVRLYSVARHRDGKIVDRLALELPNGSHAFDVLTALSIHPDLEAVVSVNEVICYEDMLLHEGDQIAIIPAVAGG